MGLDGVEIVMAWEEAFEITITDGDACEMRNTQRATDIIFQKLQSGAVDRNGNLPQRAFHRLRRAFYQTFATPRKDFKLTAKVIQLVPSEKLTKESWEALRCACGVTSLPMRPNSFFRRAFFDLDILTVAKFVDYLVIEHTATLKTFDEAWSYNQVRDVVRAVLRDQLAIQKFTDKADFIHDLGVG